MAERELREVQRQWPEVVKAAETLREIRERNHFAELITASFRGGRP